MKPQELRIGNLIFYEGKTQMMTDINMEFPLMDTPEYGVGATSWDKAEPIPLSSEFLYLFPDWFQDLISGGYMNYQALPLGFVEIRYIHTAQNLYFALTGKELTLKA